jgi:hypothetical protein
MALCTCIFLIFVVTEMREYMNQEFRRTLTNSVSIIKDIQEEERKEQEKRFKHLNRCLDLIRMTLSKYR